MFRSKKTRKLISLITSLVLMMSLALPALAAAKTSDVSGHWAENEIAAWINQGLLKGFNDGTIRPDQEISRAEFMAFVNRAFGLSNKAEVNFSDIPANSTAWYVNDIAIAIGEGYIQGYSDGTVRPNASITRQEVAAIVARILDLKHNDNNELLNKFVDAASFAAWSKGAIAAVVESGYMKGTANNAFQPFRNITRAEAVVTLDRAINDKFVIYGKPDTYGPDNGVETINGNVMISVAGVTLQNVVITGDLLLGVGIGEGDVYLNGVTVKGKTTVQGGGENSIHVINSELFTVVVDKQNGTVRIVATGSTSIEDVTLQSGAKLEATESTGEGFKNVSVKVTNDGQVVLSGDFQNVQIDVPNVSVALASGSIQQLNVNETAQNASIKIDEGAKVAELKLDAKTDVSGTGTITKAVINTEGSIIAQKPETVEVAEGVSANVGGEAVSESTTPAPPVPPATGGGGGGGGGGGDTGGNVPPSDVGVTGITLNKSKLVLPEEASETLIATIAPGNATNKNVIWSSDKEDVATVDATGKVTAVGVGTATVKVTSVADSGKHAEATVIVEPQKVLALTLDQPSAVTSIKMNVCDSDTKRCVEESDIEIKANNMIILPGSDKKVVFFITRAVDKVLFSYETDGINRHSLGQSLTPNNELVPYTFELDMKDLRNDTPSIKLSFANAPDPSKTTVNVTPGAKGSKSMNFEISVFDKNGAPINGLSPASILAMNHVVLNMDSKTETSPVRLGINNLLNKDSKDFYNIDGVKVSDIVALNNTLSFTLTFTEEGLSSEGINKFAYLKDGDSVGFEPIILGMMMGQQSFTLPGPIGSSQKKIKINVNPSGSVEKLLLKVNGEFTEIENNEIQMQDDISTFEIHATPLSGKALLNYKMSWSGSSSVGYAGEVGRTADELGFNMKQITSDNPTIDLYYVNAPDMEKTTITSVPGPLGSKSVDITITAIDSNGEAINGIKADNVSLTLKGDNDKPVWLPLGNYINSIDYNIYGLKVSNFDTDYTDNKLSFTVKFTTHGMSDPSGDMFSNLVDGESVSFDTSVLRVVKSALSAELPITNVANVSSIDNFKSALLNDNISIINIDGNIVDIGERLVIDRPVTINGNDNQLQFNDVINTAPYGSRHGILVKADEVTINNLIVTMTKKAEWQGTYGIQVYDSKNVTINNYTGTNGDAALLINGSDVTLTGTIVVSGNEFGGIEVSKGVGVTSNSLLTVNATLVNNTEAYGLPTIWEDNISDSVTGGVFTKSGEVKPNQQHYYLMEENALDPVTKAILLAEQKISVTKFVYEASVDFGSGNELVEPWGNFAYSKDGAFYMLQLKKNEKLVSFSSVFKEFKLRTEAQGTVNQTNGNWHDFTSGDRNQADFTGEKFNNHNGTNFLSTGTLRGTVLNGTLFYGIHSSILGVNIAKGDVRIIEFDTKIRTDVEAGEYVLTIRLYSPVRNQGSETKYTLEELIALDSIESSTITFTIPEK